MVLSGGAAATTTAVQSAEKQPITLAVIDFPPFTILNRESMVCDGPFVDRVLEIFEASPYSINVVCNPPARLFRRLGTGDVDFTINISSTKGIQGKVEFFNRPFSFINLSLVSYLDAQQDTVASVRAYDYAGSRQVLSEQGYRFIDVPSPVDAVRIFLHRRSEHIITYKGPFEYMLKQMGETFEDRFIVETIASIPTYFAVSKTSVHSEGITAWIASYSSKMEEDLSFMREPYIIQRDYSRDIR